MQRKWTKRCTVYLEHPPLWFIFLKEMRWNIQKFFKRISKLLHCNEKLLGAQKIYKNSLQYTARMKNAYSVSFQIRCWKHQSCDTTKWLSRCWYSRSQGIWQTTERRVKYSGTCLYQLTHFKFRLLNFIARIHLAG